MYLLYREMNFDQPLVDVFDDMKWTENVRKNEITVIWLFFATYIFALFGIEVC